MAILITGADGFVGRHLANALEKAGFETEIFAGDICDRENVLNFGLQGKKIEYIFHLAGAVNQKDRAIFDKVNVQGTKNMIELCRMLVPQKLIFMSSLRALSSLSDPYIDSKKAAEKEIENSGLPYIILRPSMLYGPGDQKNISFLTKLAKKFKILPALNFKMQPIYIEDFMKVAVKTLELPAGEKVNMAGKTATYLELLEAFKKNGMKFKVINFPSVFSFLIKTFSVLPFSPMPAWQVRTLFSGEIFREYGWREKFNIKEISLEEGVSKII